MQVSLELELLTEAPRNADGLVEDESGNLMLVEPYEKSEDFTTFLDYIQAEAGTSEQERKGRNVKYCQTRVYALRRT